MIKQTFFVQKSENGIVLLLLYVDDLIVTGDNEFRILKHKQCLNHKFEMKDLGLLNYFLGLEVTTISSGYSFSQVKYVSGLISRSGITYCKIASSPLEHDCKLNSTDDILLHPSDCFFLGDSLISLKSKNNQ